VLIRLPFSFDLTLKGSVHVKYRGHSLVGVSFKGGLSGPSPLVLRGEVCVSLLFLDACWSDSFELGDPGAIAGAAISSLVPVLAEELSRASNLAIVDGDDGLVLLARRDEAARVALSPLGAPTWSQNRLPLGLPITTFEDGRLDVAQRLEVRASVPTDVHDDWFSPGAFVELSDAEEMALPAFERHQSGVVVSLDVTRSAGVSTTVAFEEIRLPDLRRLVDGLDIPDHVLDRMRAVAAPATIRPRPGRFGLRDDRFTVQADGVTVTAGLSAVAAHLAHRGGRGSIQHAADGLVTVTVA
jgi:hypothetical protein